ncbi:hypothetical protein CY35_05G105800 [Sphagnum magellanicum]|nr:hypothetical protein CY35_05G105800 [Sphagnum magellanicum]KAH9563073.1 hypothetical protein CY35_05G105800 [Sphagnum magellanicum]
MAAMCMLAACAHFPHGLRCFSSHCTPCPSVFRLHRSTVLRSTASAGVKKKRNAMCCGSAHQDGDSPRFQFSISSIRNKEDGGEKNASLEQQQQQQQQKNQRHRVVAELQQFQAGKAMGGALYHGAKQVDSQLKALLFLFFAAGFSAGIAVALCAVSFKASRAKQGTIADVQAVPTVAMVAGTVFSPDQLLGHLRSEEAPTSDLKAVLADERCQHLQALVSTIQAMHLILEIWLLQKLSLNQNLIKLLHFLGFKPMLLGSILRCHSLKTTSKV